ncbi:PREDICTED: matrix metalloproteinase-18-like [Nanorana parkeri]|uniref:matrix metalloproteinase-18-like n=1 Tax=Nanorana parkeri TaxID=125878 RepID=UPI0008542513|nr:PREDICTED: matrix metalloproteinase-18-like [Nanorana parkeri]
MVSSGVGSFADNSEFGWILNWQKYSEVPSFRLEYLGLILDSSVARVFVPQKKLQNLCIQPIFEDTVNEDDIEILSGETNTVPMLQPRGRKLEMPIKIQTEQFKLAVEYLIEFGYLPDDNLTDYDVPDAPFITEHQIPEEFISGLEWFQRQNGLNVTGKLDEQTTEAMKLPRCGKHEQRMAYNRGARWKTDMLTYKIINTTAKLQTGLVRDELVKAIKVWESASPLKFVEVNVNQTADIDIFFVSGLHNDGERNAFDGPGRVLGHAFMPPFSKSKKSIDGDLHLDNDEKWTINEKKGVNLLQAAAHELGHSLGLEHSTIPGALMAPTYKGYKPLFELHPDDIEAIQALYGKPTAKKNSSSSSPEGSSKVVTPGPGKKNITASATLSDNKDPKKQSIIKLCGDEEIDTFVSTKDGAIYVFKGEYFWDLSHGKLPMAPKKKHPQLISSKWKELPASIDAAIRMQNPVADQDGKIFFFKGTKYWKYENDKIEAGYPKAIKEGFPGIPHSVDAAFTQPAIVAKGGKVIREERIFFIKGKKYFLYDPVSGNSTKPESLEEDWFGVKLPITAALSLKNEMYLIGRKKFQKILMLTYSHNRVYGQIQQAKPLNQLLLCESTKP